MREAMPTLADDHERAGAGDGLPWQPGTRSRAAGPGGRFGLELAGERCAGLAALDAGGGRLLLFPPDGGLLLFTGERTTRAPTADSVGGLVLTGRPGGGVRLRFAGPLARFPDTTPFLDLEEGLARASVADDARVALDFVPDHDGGDAGAEFGRVRGSVTVDGASWAVDACAFAAVPALPSPAPWPRLRAALRLPGGAAIFLTLGMRDGRVDGFLCNGQGHRAVESAVASLGSGEAPLDGLDLDVHVTGEGRLRIRVEPVHRLPVVRGGPGPPVRMLFAACRLSGERTAIGWCELGGY
jgi:hypothetical protein